VKDPHFASSPDAVYEAARLYQEMGEKFGDLSDYKNAAKLYRFLNTDYDGNKHCADALLRLGTICEGPLQDEKAAQDAYTRLRVYYKSSPAAALLAARVQSNENKPALLTTQAPAATPAPSSASIPPSGGKTSALSHVRDIQFQSNKDYTEVVIGLDGEARYSENHLSEPERIYFDIAHSRLDRNLLDRTFVVSDKLLKQVRVAQNQPDAVRVVFDLNSASAASASALRDPFRIVVEIRDKGVPIGESVSPGRSPSPLPSASGKGMSPLAATPEVRAPESASSKPDLAKTPKTQVQNAERSSKVDGSNLTQQVAVAAPPQPKTEPSTPENRQATVSSLPPALDSEVSPAPLPASRSEPKPLADKRASPIEQGKNTQPEAAVATREAANRSASAGMKEPAKVDVPPVPVSPSLSPLPKTSLPTSKGDRTLTRTLGLKIGRIVLDPGHGGQDKGTIGPGGLMEKDLVLQVAKDLQQLLKERLGAEVILTRNDDTFIPLEERTAFANQQQADLFLSIHANSSPSRNVSGVETYYLDFARTDYARDVAARENATSDHNLRDLQDLIQRIAEADKHEESRELASIIQKNLYTEVRKMIPACQDRGVRSAPFVVLIGAHMPSVLAEVAFISNPRDEKLLKKEVSQQSLATALFRGIEGYMQTLGTVVSQNRGNSK
jgi:N-acetylmuramoyl-L-alanine amidase